MNLPEDLQENLWNDLGSVIINPEKVDELKNNFENPVKAAKFRADEIYEQIKLKYGESKAWEIITSIIYSAGNGFVEKINGRLVRIQTFPSKKPEYVDYGFSVRFSEEGIGIENYLKSNLSSK